MRCKNKQQQQQKLIHVMMSTLVVLCEWFFSSLFVPHCFYIFKLCTFKMLDFVHRTPEKVEHGFETGVCHVYESERENVCRSTLKKV